jgi:hypothetical protein
MNLYEQLERKGHPDPQVKRLFPRIREAIEFYPILQARKIAARDQEPDLPILRATAEHQKHVLSRLWACCQDGEPADPSDVSAVWPEIQLAVMHISLALVKRPIRVHFEDHAPEETFARLAPFTARVKLRQGLGTVERTIRTSKPEVPTGDWRPRPVGTPVHQLDAQTTRRDARRVIPEEDEPMSPTPDERSSPAVPRPSRRRVVIARDGQHDQGEK